MSFIVIEYKSRATFVHFSTLSVKTVMEVARWPVAPYGILSLKDRLSKQGNFSNNLSGFKYTTLPLIFKAVSKSVDVE